MRKFNLAASFIFFSLLIVPSLIQAQMVSSGEKEKIEALIKVVSQLKTATFMRNGSSYSADTAATFLRLKWRANDSLIKTAHDFIDKIGSISGTSGKPYRIRMRDGTELNSRDFLLGELEKLETLTAQQGATGG
jgi:hypothetical protein